MDLAGARDFAGQADSGVFPYPILAFGAAAL